MTTFSFELNDERFNDIIDAWCFQEGYSPLIDDGQDTNTLIPNPVSKLEFAQRTVKRKMQEAYIRYASELARIAAENLAQNEV